MKPWFENELIEADIIDFPKPKAKVIRMPNVQEYPDFITGVSDLQAKQKDGTISQETYNKLYTDLIHKFMKKETFENPWFLREATLQRTTPTSVSTYIGNINQLLQKNANMPYGKQGEKTFIPTPGQKVKKLNDPLVGKIDGKDVSINTNQLYKSKAIKGEERKSWNVGYVSEGLFGMGLFLALLANRNIVDTDIRNGTLRYLKTNGGKVSNTNRKTKDKISLQIYLPLNDWKALIDSTTFDHPEISAHANSIANYVNNSEDFRNMNNQFRTNKKIDRIEVIADGRSEQKATTVDVYIRYAGGKTTKFQRSIKSGKVKQFGQAPVGGALSQKPDDTGRYSREERWDYQEKFWYNLGVNISAAENDFLDVPSLKDAFDFSYKAAADDLDKELKGDKRERITLRNLFRATQNYAGAKVVHIYSGGYRIMDFKKLDSLVNSTNLKAIFNPTENFPRVSIVDEKGAVFLEIELKTDKYKASNQINMGPLLKEITTVEKRDN